MSGVTMNRGTDVTMILGNTGLVPPSSISTPDTVPLVGCLLHCACSSALFLLQRWLESWLTPVPAQYTVCRMGFFGSGLLGGGIFIKIHLVDWM